MTERRGRRRKQLVNDYKEKREYCKLKGTKQIARCPELALEETLCEDSINGTYNITVPQRNKIDPIFNKISISCRATRATPVCLLLHFTAKVQLRKFCTADGKRRGGGCSQKVLNKQNNKQMPDCTTVTCLRRIRLLYLIKQIEAAPYG